MRNIDMRRILTVLLIIVVGLYLLVLGSPSFGGGSLSLLPMLTLLFSLLPVAGLAVLLFYVFGKNPEHAQKRELRKQIAKTLAGIAAFGIAIGVFLTWLSTKFSPWSPGTPRYLLENSGVALLFVAFASLLLLLSTQRGTYFPFWSKDDKLHADERQRAVRNRVYERSYQVILVLLAIAFWLHATPSQRLHDEVFQAMALCLFGVPAIIAAWQKDS